MATELSREVKVPKPEERLLRLDSIDKDPFFETFDVFQNLNLRGMTLIKALDVVLKKADELYANWKNIVNVNKIPAYRYAQGNFEFGIMNEEKVFEHINKSVSMLEYHHAILNLISISNFYKRAYYKSQVYEPFFKYITKIFEKFQEIQDIINNFEEKKIEIDQLSGELQLLQKQNSELRLDKDKLMKNFHLFENQYKNLFLNERIMKFFIGVVDAKIIRSKEGYSVFQLISHILWDGRQSLFDLSKQMGLTQKEIKDIVKPYQQLFIIIDNKYIDLNFELGEIKKEKVFLEFDEMMEKYGLKEIEDTDELELKKYIPVKKEVKMEKKIEIPKEEEMPEEEQVDEELSEEDIPEEKLMEELEERDEFEDMEEDNEEPEGKPEEEE